MSYEDKLREIAYTNVGPIVYPTPTATIEDQITATVQDINALKQEKVSRPATKAEYIELLEQLETEKLALIAQNDQIVAGNATARKDAEETWNAAIAAEMLKPEVIAAARLAWDKENYAKRLDDIEMALLEVA